MSAPNGQFSLNFSLAPHTLGLAAITLTTIAWAIAANVANSLFLEGAPP